MMEKVGVWSFYIGLLVAIIAGVMGSLTSLWAWILIVLGLIVGLLNITDKESNGFLLAGAVLMVFGFAGSEILKELSDIKMVSDIIKNFVIFVGPAALIVALKKLYEITKSK